MNINADLIGRYVLRMAAEIEALTIQRDALSAEVERLRKENEQLKPKAGEPGNPGPVLVRDPEGA